MNESSFILPGDTIPLDDRTRDELGRHITSLIHECEPTHHRDMKKLDVLWKLYRAEPREKERSFPFRSASNVVVPLIRTHSDNLTSRRFNSLTPSKEIWIEDIYDEATTGAAELRSFINAASNGNEFDLHRPLYSALRESTVAGTGILGLKWVRKVEHVIDPQSLRNGRTPRTLPVTTKDGPDFYHIPRRDILWTYGYRIHEAPLIARYCPLTKAQLATRARSAGWHSDSITKITKAPDSDLSRAFFSTSEHNAIFSGPDQFWPYDVREVWLHLETTQSLDTYSSIPHSKLITPKVLAYIHKPTGTLLHLMASPFALRNWPFYDPIFRGAGSDGPEDGVAEMLEQLQALTTAFMNQAADTVTVANAITGVTNQRELIDQPIDVSKWIYVPDPSDSGVRLLNPPKSITPDIALFQIALGLAERVTGATDPSFGKEIRQGGHPSPATSTLTLLQEASKLLQTTQTFDRQLLGRMGEDLVALYQQFASTEADRSRYSRWIGAADGEAAFELISGPSITGRVGFDVRALTEEHNPEAARQRAIFIDQAVTNYFARLTTATEALARATQTGNTLQAEVLKRMMRALTESTKEVLKSSRLDDIERFLMENSQNDRPQQLIEQLGSAIQQGLTGAEASPTQQPPTTGLAVPPGSEAEPTL